MKVLGQYLKHCWHLIVFVNIFFLVVNGMMMTSGVQLVNVDVVYMNVLLSVLTVLFFVADYIRFTRIMRQNEEVQFELESLTENLTESEEDYQVMADYLTKWAHEVKVPISVARLIGESMADEASVELNLELDRMHFLINQLLSVSRSGSANQDLKIEPVDLKILALKGVKDVKRLLISKNIEVAMDVDDGVQTTVLSDRKWLSYMIAQVLHNSYKYVDAGGFIRIRIEEEKTFIHLQIMDNGIGVKDHEFTQIFNRGYVGNNGRNSDQSTGFGLYLSKRIGETLDVALEAEQNKYGGLTIHIKIPKESPDVKMMKSK